MVATPYVPSDGADAMTADAAERRFGFGATALEGGPRGVSRRWGATHGPLGKPLVGGHKGVEQVYGFPITCISSTASLAAGAGAGAGSPRLACPF